MSSWLDRQKLWDYNNRIDQDLLVPWHTFTLVFFMHLRSKYASQQIHDCIAQGRCSRMQFKSGWYIVTESPKYTKDNNNEIQLNHYGRIQLC